ncbi:MAG: hypothetical protein IJ737_03755 [Ruminococcus sp.]|nr:hypothetical protein [Ruminococcus sp.]
MDFDCTMLGYLKMGMPNQVLIYKTEHDYKEGAEPLTTRSFSINTEGDCITRVELSVSATPDWLEGAWGSAHYDGEGGTFSGFHTYATRITIIDDHRLMYEVYYYQDYYHPEFSYGQDYAYEREYTYDPDTETVLIPRTDTGVIVGKIYDWSGTSMEKDHLDPLKIQRTPDKDHLTDHVSARFTFDPMELTGKDTERDGSLHYIMNDEDIKYGTMPVL